MLLKIIKSLFSKEIKREVDERAVAISNLVGGKDRSISITPFRLRCVNGKVFRVYELITPEPSAEAVFDELLKMRNNQVAILKWLGNSLTQKCHIPRAQYQLKVLEKDLEAACLHLPLDLSKLLPKNVSHGK